MTNPAYMLHSVTSGFLVTVTIFFVLMGIVQVAAHNKIEDVLEQGDDRRNNKDRLKKAQDQSRVAYILSFIGAGLSILLAILYGGQERAWVISGWVHSVIFLATYALLIISAIYAFLAINELNHLDVEEKNGSTTYLWVSLLLGLFAFIGLTGSGSAQVGLSSIRKETGDRITAVEDNVNTHLPVVRQKVDELHRSATMQRLGSSNAALPAIPPSTPLSVSRSVTTSPEATVATTSVRRSPLL